MERPRPHRRHQGAQVTLTPEMTEHGITRSLRFAKSGHGFSLGDEYRHHLIECGWITKDCAITREGLVELAKRERAGNVA